jgi:hypothetical protein
MVDVESDGPIPGDYSMVSFGAIVVDDKLDKTFIGKLKPISDKYIPETLSVSGFTRKETLNFEDPKPVMEKFTEWLKTSVPGKPVFISDNNGFDWMFMCWYFYHFTGANPFGQGSYNLGSVYKGMMKDFTENFMHLRKTKHTGNPLDEARDNTEVLLAMKNEHGLRIKF